MTTQQPEALRLANILRGIDARSLFANEKLSAASAALENQHARITELEAKLEAVGAGGVGPLMGIAAPPTAQAEGWMPIETAPKDKTNVILLRQACGSVANGFWLAEAYAGNGSWIWPYVHKNPTHWIPAPPIASEAKGAGHA
jgi:hypothetical protein